jgi:hypothetical protein
MMLSGISWAPSNFAHVKPKPWERKLSALGPAKPLGRRGNLAQILGGKGILAPLGLTV